MKTRFNIEKILKTSLGSQVKLASLELSSSPSSQKPEGSKEYVFRTPMYFIHTQTGSIPHITPEVFDIIYPTSSRVAEGCSVLPPVQISLDSTYKFEVSIEKFQQGISKFVGLPDLPTFLTIHDPLQGLRSGHNDKFGIALWSRHGRTGLTPDAHTSAVKAFQPSLSQIISDYDVQPENCGLKRLKKSLNRAEEYTAHTLKEKEDSIGFETGLFVTLEAAWFSVDEEQAKKTVAKLMESQHKIDGVVIVGLTDRFVTDVNNGKNTKSSTGKEKVGRDRERLDICNGVNLELVDKIVHTLPSSLPKFAPGPFKLPDMVSMMCRGIDIFDTSVASRMADDGVMFILDEIESSLSSLCSSSVVKPIDANNETLPERSTSSNSNTSISLKESKSNGCSSSEQQEGISSLISLKDKRFFDDFRPVSGKCSCYTCRKHTRSYIHHLFATDELLGPVLVQIHNLTALDRFFQIIQGTIKDSDSSESLEEKITLLQNLLRTDSPENVEVKERI